MPPSSGPRGVKPVKVRVKPKPNPQVFGPIGQNTIAKPTPKPAPRKAPKARVVKPPAGDVASSGGDYGKRRAAPTVKRELKAVRVKQSQTKDVKSNADLQRGQAFLKAHPEILHPPKPHHGGGIAGTALSALGDVAAAAAFPALTGAAAASDKVLGTKILPGAAKAVKNAPGDAAELAITAPSSLAKLGSDVVHHPTEVPGELAAPYQAFFKHPAKFFTEKPVTTALMFSPGVRGPGLIAGKIARVAGKQSLERATATLPGTALRETRLGSRDYVLRARQVRKDAKNPNPTVTLRQVQKRVDEAFGAQQKHRDRIEHAIAQKTKEQAKALPKGEREAFIAEQAAAARGAAKAQAHREYVKEFGATAFHNDQGALVKPKNATEGVLHNTREEAQAVADKLNRKPLTLKHGGFTKAETLLPAARKPAPVKFVVSQAGEKFGVLPDVVSTRIAKHGGVGTSMAPGAKLLRQSRGMFTRAVLPTRPTWLSGQAIEGTVRNVVEGAGPTSYLRSRKVLAEMERQEPGSSKALLDRAVPAGKIGKVMKEFAGERKTFAEDFPGNPVAESLTALGRTPGIKQVRDVYHAMSNVVFQHINGQALEAFPQTVMLGRALKKSPLLDHRIIGLGAKSIEEAARGARDTPTMNMLARDLQRGYGKYSNFGPGLREAIVHWTPFIPWTLNAVRFLTTVLPRDHPVLTALIASASVAEEDWRRAHRLSTLSSNKLPFFDLGGYPINGGGAVARIGHYVPFGVATDPTGGLASMVLPQFSGLYGALQYGSDWKGKPLRNADGSKYNDAQKWLYGLHQLAEAMIPLSQQTQDVVTSKHPARQVQKELRLISTTKVKPAKTTKSSDPWSAPSTSGGSGWDAPTKASPGDGWG